MREKGRMKGGELGEGKKRRRGRFKGEMGNWGEAKVEKEKGETRAREDG